MHIVKGLAPFILLTSVAGAQQPTPELQALDDALPGTLINDPSRLDLQIYGKDKKTKSVRDAAIPGGGAAVQIDVTSAGKAAHDVGANIPVTTGIKAGSDVVIAFYARTIKAETSNGQGRIGVRFQQNAAPYPGFGDSVVTIGPEWKLHEVSARADRDIDKGQAVVSLQLAGAKQLLQVGQIIVVEGAKSILPPTQQAAAPAAGPVLPPQLAGKGRLINDPARRGWGIYGAGLKHQDITVGIPGGVATRLEIAAPGAARHEAGINIPIDEAIRADDGLIVAFTARTVAARTPDGRAVLGIRVQRNAAPYPGFGDNEVRVGPNWQLLQLRTRADIDIEKGAGGVALHLAGAEQTLEIGSVYILSTAAQ